MPTTTKRLTKKTAVAVAQPVVQDEEPVEVAPAVAPADEEPVALADEEPEQVVEVADDEPSDEEEEEDVVLTLLKQQEANIIEQMCKTSSRINDTISGKLQEMRDEKKKLQELINALDESIDKHITTAQHTASHINEPLRTKLDKVRATLAVHLGQKVIKTRQHKASGEKLPTAKNTFFSRKPLNEMVNQNTRFIYEQKRGILFKRFCLISKNENCVYECDENGTKKGVALRSLNDFCVMVKKSVNYQGALKQDTSVVLKYYDISSQSYKCFKELTTPLN